MGGWILLLIMLHYSRRVEKTLEALDTLLTSSKKKKKRMRRHLGKLH